ncbi:MAG: phospholipase [Dehalococcoidia bacterium]|nr:phospholipase [Dehalococcoidia bacterium]
MQAKRCQGSTLAYLMVEPDGYTAEVDYPLVVLLHGFGASMDDLAGLCPAIDRGGYLYACPNGPLPFAIAPGVTGYGWTPPRGQAAAEDAGRAKDLLDAFFQEVMELYNVPPGRVLLGGFSQGGGMTYRCGLPRPETFRGLAALSSVMPEPAELRPTLPGPRTQAIFISHGTSDDILPVEEGRKALEFLQAEGYAPDYREYPMRHEINAAVMGDLVPWIRDLLPPATP